MANNAVINFLFNSQGAVRELNNFKQKFSSAIEAIEESGIGKFARIGSAIAGAFSIKSFMDYAKAISDFHTLFESTPLDQVGKFVNSMRLLNREVTSESALTGLEHFKKVWDDAFYHGGKLPDILKVLNISNRDINGKIRPITEIYDEFIKKAREMYKTLDAGGKSRFGDELTNQLEGFGFSKDIVVSIKKLISLDEELYKQHQKTLGGMYTPTEEDNKAAEKLAQSITLLNNAFERLGGTLAKNKFVNEVIEGFANAVNSFAELPEDTQNKILGIGTAILSIGPGLKLVKSLMPFINPFTVFVGLIAAFALNLGGVRDKADEAVKSWQAFVDDFKKEHPLEGSFLQELLNLINSVLHPIESLKKAWADLKREILGTDDLAVHGGNLISKNRERADRILNGKATAGDYASGAWNHLTDKISEAFLWGMNRDDEIRIKQTGTSRGMSQNNNINVEVTIEGNADERNVRTGIYQGISDAFSDISGNNTSVLYGEG